MSTSKITSKGQITLPKEIRDFLGLKPGDSVRFDARSADEVVLKPKRVDALSLLGMLSSSRKKSVSVKDMDRGIAFHLKKKYTK